MAATTSRQLKGQAIRTFFESLQNINPHPKTELNYNSHFQLLAAVLLSAQTTDVAVNKCTPALFADAPDVASMASLGASGIVPFIRSIGLYNSKAKNLAASAQILLESYQGEIPANRESLQRLPGVGRKTANVVLNEAFGEPTIAVDTHVFRVSNRTGLAQGKTPEQVEKRLIKLVPQEFARHAHHWLIMLGRYTCLARSPKCTICPVYTQCTYPSKRT